MKDKYLEKLSNDMEEHYKNAIPVKKKIITTNVYPPIPIRQFDWMAHFENDEEDGARGWGRTEEEAIANLKDESFDDEECGRCGTELKVNANNCDENGDELSVHCNTLGEQYLLCHKCEGE